MEDKHTNGKKMARNGRTKVIYKGTFVSIQTLPTVIHKHTQNFRVQGGKVVIEFLPSIKPYYFKKQSSMSSFLKFGLFEKHT